MKEQKIMACIDLSTYSEMVLSWAVDMAQASQARLLVYSVVNQRDIDSAHLVGRYYPNTINIETYLKELKAKRTTQVQAFISKHQPQLTHGVEIVVDTGIPYESILNAVESLKADILVMANKGRGNMERLLFGSCAEKVFRHSPVPVLSVRQRHIFNRR